ncbi:transcriptional regulator [Arthrobacter sp. CAN_C5]|uniref:transcriptional regulator n=1 Tax=Arthrobacter sp. CAN_C5 TaxID=2760706 RepID=UPI001AE6E414|nr:transcriptional regulator [Arthrobacter sp. CAN_C5]MBP2217355.1 hypothetical protein [Arthrobacter sp. CAN_C5]
MLIVVFLIGRANIRTVRPRHFNLVEGFAALWLGVGEGIANQVLGPAGSNEAEEQGYLEAQKSFLAKKPQTVFRLTRRGRTAFRDHTTALRDIQRGLR